MIKTITKTDSNLMRRICAELTMLAKNLDKRNDRRGTLSARQYMAMLVIKNLPLRETTMVNIARKLGTSKQNINQLVPMLERRGFVSRIPCEGNKRNVNVVVNPSGLRALRKYEKSYKITMNHIFNDFTETEMQTLLALLEKLRLNCVCGRQSDDEIDSQQDAMDEPA